MRVGDPKTQILLPVTSSPRPPDRAGAQWNQPVKPSARPVYSVSNETYGSLRTAILVTKGRFVNTVA